MHTYNIILKNHSDKALFLNEMQEISALEFVPNRSCETENIPDTRCCRCSLSEEEVNNLKNDPRIQSISIKSDTLRNIPAYISNIDIIPTIKISGLGTLSAERYYPKLDTFTNQNKKENNFKTQSLSSVSAYIDNLPNGSGVDVVIVDGILGGNLSIQQSDGTCDRSGSCLSVLTSSICREYDPDNVVHPEFTDAFGNSRVKSIDWNLYSSTAGPYPYETLLRSSNTHLHGMHVGGIVAGKTYGWAKQSDIYNISPYDYPDNPNEYLNNYKFITSIINWHAEKINNNNTRPTITNHSYGIIDYVTYDTRYISSVTVSGVTYDAPRNDGGAIVTANVDASGNISSFTIVNPGSGYINEPTISFNGGGGDEAEIIMASGTIKEIIVTDVGSGYDDLSPPNVVFSASPDGITASGTCVVVNGKISSITFLDRGTGYVDPPTVTFDSPVDGTTATATVSVGSNFIHKIQIVNAIPPAYRFLSALNLNEPPPIIISGGDCVKNAMWLFDFDILVNKWMTPNYWWSENLLDPSFEGATISDGLYKIVEAKTVLTETSFKQTFLGGEYNSKPDVSFLYLYFPNRFSSWTSFVGPMAYAKVNNGEIVSVSGGFYMFDSSMDILAVPENQGPFTSPPQVFLTNGGGFSAQQLDDWNIPLFKWIVGGDGTIDENGDISYDPYSCDNTGCDIRVYPSCNLCSHYSPIFVAPLPAVDDAFDSVINDAVNSGVIVVGAAGNSNTYQASDSAVSIERINTNFPKSNPSILFEQNLSSYSQLVNLNFPGSWPIIAARWIGNFGVGPGVVLGDYIFNQSDNLRGSSPSSASGCITVGSIGSVLNDSNEEIRSSFSNYGPNIDIWAPGHNILSSWYINNICNMGDPEYDPGMDSLNNIENATDQRYGIKKLSGTSMASPQVCGAIASYLTSGNVVYSNNIPEQVRNWIQDNGRPVLSDGDYPYANLDGSTNKILYYSGIMINTPGGIIQ